MVGRRSTKGRRCLNVAEVGCSLWTHQMHCYRSVPHLCSVPDHAELLWRNSQNVYLHLEDSGNLFQSFTSSLLGHLWAAGFPAPFWFFLCLAPPVLEASGFAAVPFPPQFHLNSLPPAMNCSVNTSFTYSS